MALLRVIFLISASWSGGHSFHEKKYSIVLKLLKITLRYFLRRLDEFCKINKIKRVNIDMSLPDTVVQSKAFYYL